MPDQTPPDDELFIHLDLAGLAALMKATEAAMATGRGRLELGSGNGGITVSSGTTSFPKVTLTFSDPGGGGGPDLADWPSAASLRAAPAPASACATRRTGRSSNAVFRATSAN